jgi:hypothetical protein
MTLGDAVAGLGEQTEWVVIKDFIKEQRDMCLVDFQDYTHVDNPQKLARLSGEIAGLNRWIEESDIEDTEIAKIAMEDLEEWLDEDVVDFECDMVLEDDDEDEEEG